MHATEFLKSAADRPPSLIVLHGTERHLKQAVLRGISERVLGADDDGMGASRFAGKDADLKSVLDELATISMWGDCRLVVVSDADEFVSRNRSVLEKTFDKPPAKSVLVLETRSWPKNTRLHKKLAKTGLEIDCSELKGAALERWVASTADSEYGKKAERHAVRLLLELAGSNLALLDQELAKLTAFVGDRPEITAEDVSAVVGGWKARTTWEMIDAVQSGQLGQALAALEKLLIAGEAPQRILGGINYKYRQLAQAVELARQGQPLTAALRKAGVFRPSDVDAANRYLRRVGRERAESFYRELLNVDSGLKGGSRLPERVQLEQLLVTLSGAS